MALAQYERKMTSMRTIEKMRWRAERGLWNGGIPPLGYTRDPDKKGMLVPVPAEAEVVRLLFDRYLEAGSVTALVRWLSRNGIRIPVRRTKEGEAIGGGGFYKSVVLEMLQKPVYVGKVSYEGQEYPAKHPPIWGAPRF